MKVKHVRVIIVQPRLYAQSEYTRTREELLAFGEEVRTAIARAEAPDAPRIPGEKQCRWCPGKATCPELAAKVQAETLADFDEVTPPANPDPVESDDQLAAKMSLVDLIEQWCKAVRGEVERRLLAGTPVPGWKLVQGKRGNRAWISKEVAEQTLRDMRIKHEAMYDYSVISPTTAEKRVKEGEIGPRQWKKLQELITQAEGKPSVAPESDKRPALDIKPLVEMFNDQIEVSDLV